MKAAKIISLVGGILYLWFFVGFLITFFKLKDVYSGLDTHINYLIPTIALLIGLGLVIANFGYFFYLYMKGKKNEEVKNAILVSVLLVVVPLSLYLLFTTLSLILPIYNVRKAF